METRETVCSYLKGKKGVWQGNWEMKTADSRPQWDGGEKNIYSFHGKFAAGALRGECFEHHLSKGHCLPEADPQQKERRGVFKDSELLG